MSRRTELRGGPGEACGDTVSSRTKRVALIAVFSFLLGSAHILLGVVSFVRWVPYALRVAWKVYEGSLAGPHRDVWLILAFCVLEIFLGFLLLGAARTCWRGSPRGRSLHLLFAGASLLGGLLVYVLADVVLRDLTVTWSRKVLEEIPHYEHDWRVSAAVAVWYFPYPLLVLAGWTLRSLRRGESPDAQVRGRNRLLLRGGWVLAGAVVIVSIASVLWERHFWPGKPEMGDDRVAILIWHLDHRRAYVRRTAAERLTEIGDRRAIGPLLESLDDDAMGARRSKGHALCALAAREVVPQLIRMLESGHPGRAGAAYALGHIGAPEAVEPLIAALKDRDPLVRYEAAAGLGKMEAGASAAIPALQEAAAGDKEYYVREAAASGLERIQTAPATRKAKR